MIDFSEEESDTEVVPLEDMFKGNDYFIRTS